MTKIEVGKRSRSYYNHLQSLLKYQKIHIEIVLLNCIRSAAADAVDQSLLKHIGHND